MVQAAAAGAINFRDADILDREWWTKVKWLVEAYDSQKRVDLCHVQLRRTSLMMANTDDSADYNAELADYKTTLNKLIAEMYPWEDTGPQSLEEVGEVMRDQYLETFGDPNSPEGKAEIQKLLDHWESVRNAHT